MSANKAAASISPASMSLFQKEYIIPKIKEHKVDVLLMLNFGSIEGDGNQFAKESYTFADDEDEFEDSFWELYVEQKLFFYYHIALFS